MHCSLKTPNNLKLPVTPVTPVTTTSNPQVKRMLPVTGEGSITRDTTRDSLQEKHPGAASPPVLFLESVQRSDLYAVKEGALEPPTSSRTSTARVERSACRQISRTVPFVAGQQSSAPGPGIPRPVQGPAGRHLSAAVTGQGSGAPPLSGRGSNAGEPVAGARDGRWVPVRVGGVPGRRVPGTTRRSPATRRHVVSTDTCALMDRPTSVTFSLPGLPRTRQQFVVPVRCHLHLAGPSGDPLDLGQAVLALSNRGRSACQEPL